jgi:hypothetical protein
VKDNDRKVLEFYRENPRARQKDVEAATGINVATIRNIRSRLQRVGLTPWIVPPAEQLPRLPIAAPGRISVEIRQTSAARVDPDRSSVAVSLPRFGFHSSEFDEDRRPHRLTIPVPELHPLEELMQRRLALIKQVHQEGLRRGKFRPCSR